MPSVTQEERPVVPSSLKKRRRDDQDEDTQAHFIRSDDAPLYHPHHTYQPQQGAPPRKILPTPKKLRLVEDHHERHPYQPQPQPPQARRSRTPDATALQHTTANSRPQPVARSSTTSAALLRPCHICHRKPTKKSDLDSFADCEGCAQRTCYVCMRKCLGWRQAADRQDDDDDDGQQAASQSFHMEDAPPPHSPPPDENEQAPQQQQHHHHQHREKPGWAGGRGGGHRQMVCSRCCVERGRDGDVVCLGCLPFVEA
ncbi:uncharacterized protein E0L32_003615 [Thyridium curvatum]|uniref:Uncharacterized protein n=1 Tax=Thyridium curvatum TaxID=1093900 RepID=A0A507BDB4_9PEZI|nr:uncharacterized protein E0L32_003615 [Thyridium curvatum]TPX16674.1 hypothetical protein E0L32_003615 [Thyridium curvatum]